ncbi:hypothetical protein [Alloalcanivorax marinus]|uniref:hypothetical protein n=1 Tax=Alloalcanivorax marinus TaxID=1177169 RepID=UPI0021D21517|nr:hypothetical protein [Alloalcanivorax marinus]
MRKSPTSSTELFAYIRLLKNEGGPSIPGVFLAEAPINHVIGFLNKMKRKMREQIKDVIAEISQDGNFSLEKKESTSLNFFHATDMITYEIRHASFFSYLFDSSRYPYANNFISCFLASLSDYFSGFGGDEAEVLRARKSYIKGAAASAKTRKIGAFYLPGENRFSEILCDDGKRIDFAAAVCMGSGEEAVEFRLMMEFKLGGAVYNDFESYLKKLRRKGGKDVMALVMDFSGLMPFTDHKEVLTVPVSVLEKALSEHLAILYKKTKQCDFSDFDKAYLMVDSYREAIKSANVNHLPLDEERIRKWIWRLWAPDMDRSSEWQSLSDFCGAEIGKKLGNAPFADALWNATWVTLFTSNVKEFIDLKSKKTMKGIEAKVYGDRWVRLYLKDGRLKRENKEKGFYFWISVGLGSDFGAYDKDKDKDKDKANKVYVGISLQYLQRKESEGEHEKGRRLVDYVATRMAEDCPNKSLHANIQQNLHEKYSIGRFVLNPKSGQICEEPYTVKLGGKKNKSSVMYHYYFPVEDERLKEFCLARPAKEIKSNVEAFWSGIEGVVMRLAVYIKEGELILE